MTIAHVASTGVSTATAARGTTSTTVAWTGVAAGRMAIVAAQCRPTSSTMTISGSNWMLLATQVGGASGSGADIGQTKLQVWAKILDGTETGNITISTTSGTMTNAVLSVYSRTLGAWARPIAVTANDSSQTSGSVSAATGTWPFRIPTGAMIVGCASSNTDSTTAMSAFVNSQSGTTFAAATARNRRGASDGDDGTIVTWDAACTTGGSGVTAMTLGYTQSAVTSSGPLAAVILQEGTPTSSLSDDFTTLNSTLWDASHEPGGFRVAGGRAQLDVPGGAIYNGFNQVGKYVFDDYWIQNITSPSNTGTGTYSETGVKSQQAPDGTDASYYFSINEGMVYPSLRVSYFDASATPVAIDPVAMAYRRITYDYVTNNFLFRTSPDGTTWTTRRTVAAPTWAATTDIGIHFEAHRDTGTSDVAEYDNLNLVAPSTTPVSGSLTAQWTTLSTVTGSSNALWTTRANVSGTSDVRWTTLAALSGSTDFRWGTLAAVAGSADLRWLTRANVSGVMQALWTTLQAVTGGSDIRWGTRQVVSGSLDMPWTTLQTLGSSADLRWTVTGSVGGTLDLAWTVRAAVTGSLDARWAVTAPVSSSLAVSWSVLAAVTGSADLRWLTRANVAGSSDLRWLTRSNVSGSSDLRWTTRANVAGSADLRWTSLQGIGDNINAMWTTRQNVSGSVEFDWNTLAALSGFVDLWYTTLAQLTGSANLLWTNYGRVTGSSDLRWNVNGSNIAVSGSMDLRWITNGRITGTSDLRWVTRAALSGALDARWNTLSALSGGASLPWTVLAPVSGSGSIPWTVRALVSGSADLRWTQFASVAGTLDLGWSQAGKVSGSTALLWTTRNALAGTLALLWTVRGQISGSVDARWQVSARVVGSTQLFWVVTAAPLPDQPGPYDVRVRLTDRFTAYPEQINIQYGPPQRVTVDLSDVI